MIWCVFALFIVAIGMSLWACSLVSQVGYWRPAAICANRRIATLTGELETAKRTLGLDALKAQYALEALQAIATQAHASIREIHQKFDPAPDEEQDPDE